MCPLRTAATRPQISMVGYVVWRASRTLGSGTLLIYSIPMVCFEFAGKWACFGFGTTASLPEAFATIPMQH